MSRRGSGYRRGGDPRVELHLRGGAVETEERAGRAEREQGLLAELFFPPTPREFAGRRGLKIVLRAVHVLCVSVFAGAEVLGSPTTTQDPWFLATIASGILLLALDLFESAAFLLQVRGAVVIWKLATLFCLPLFGAARPFVVSAMVLISVISSHAPSKVRYFLLVGRGRIEASRTRG